MDTKINLRIDEYTKKNLEKYAQENDKKLSEYVRDVLNDHVDEENFENDSSIDFPDSITIYSSVDFEKTVEFTKLLSWLFYKCLYPIDTNHKDVIRTLKVYVERTIDESSFSRELKIEFLKVLTDINRFLAEPEYERKQFYFSIFHHQLYFNFGMLNYEIWSKK